MLTPLVRRFFLMPMFVLASKLCPDGSEATLFSVMMSLSNFGYDVGTYFGAMLLTVCGVTDDDYTSFPIVVAIKSLMRLLPIILVPFLVPRGTPQDAAEALSRTDGGMSIASDCGMSVASLDDRLPVASLQGEGKKWEKVEGQGQVEAKREVDHGEGDGEGWEFVKSPMQL